MKPARPYLTELMIGRSVDFWNAPIRPPSTVSAVIVCWTTWSAEIRSLTSE